MTTYHGQPEKVRRRLVMEGCVQGMGFRPTVFRLARDHDMTGFVKNNGGTLCVEAEGTPATLDAFFSDVHKYPPAQAKITRCTTIDIPPHNDKGFVIQNSKSKHNSPITLPLPDLATCKECLAEIFEPDDRRHGYPFNNCINCGPRYSIQKTLPYDRLNTSMASFAMCSDCQAEFEDPRNRRFHAQAIACPVCGPGLSVVDHRSTTDAAEFSDPIKHCADALLSGAIIALKGLGGYQLIVDARNRTAVTQLRTRKGRPDKPFAIMLSSSEHALRHASATASELAALESPQAPIVLMHKRLPADATHTLSPHVAPNNHYLGIMLPYTPLHHLLLRACNAPLVVTSGNLSSDPLIVDNDRALTELDGIADVFLLHDRPIVNPVDDSVVQVVGGRVQTVRLARGMAPLAVNISSNNQATRPILALGGQGKSSIAIATADHIIGSPYIGDLDSHTTRQRYRTSLDHLQQISATRPSAVTCDKHSDYYTTQLATKLSLPTLKVQHHVAHAHACIAEHGLNVPVTCIVWDGTGAGDDGIAWGGECFHIEAASVKRRFTLLPFALPGGNKASREPRRSAIGILYTLFGDAVFSDHEKLLGAFTGKELTILQSMLQRSVNTPLTTSTGRLFDAVASLTGLLQFSSHEAHAAMMLENVAAETNDIQAYSMPFNHSPVSDAQPFDSVNHIDWRPMVLSILDDLQQGAMVKTVASRFHRSLVKLVVDMAQGIDNGTVILSGGCFQNRLLAEQCIGALREAGFTPFWPEQIPPNDGGLAFGQAALASIQQCEEVLSCV